MNKYIINLISGLEELCKSWYNYDEDMSRDTIEESIRRHPRYHELVEYHECIERRIFDKKGDHWVAEKYKEEYAELEEAISNLCVYINGKDPLESIFRNHFKGVIEKHSKNGEKNEATSLNDLIEHVFEEMVDVANLYITSAHNDVVPDKIRQDSKELFEGALMILTNLREKRDLIYFDKGSAVEDVLYKFVDKMIDKKIELYVGMECLNALKGNISSKMLVIQGVQLRSIVDTLLQVKTPQDINNPENEWPIMKESRRMFIALKNNNKTNDSDL
ncbi:MAG: hypothetical protein ACRC92_27100 [Peptostreptococcaceae bacterium]